MGSIIASQLLSLNQSSRYCVWSFCAFSHHVRMGFLWPLWFPSTVTDDVTANRPISSSAWNSHIVQMHTKSPFLLSLILLSISLSFCFSWQFFSFHFPFHCFFSTFFFLLIVSHCFVYPFYSFFLFSLADLFVFCSFQRFLLREMQIQL